MSLKSRGKYRDKAFYKLYQLGYEELSRREKKMVSGNRLSTNQLISLIIIKVNDAENRVEDFCPMCGCKSIRGTGNMTTYPEHWENFYCCRCGFEVGAIDNSPYCSIFEDDDLRQGRRMI